MTASAWLLFMSKPLQSLSQTAGALVDHIHASQALLSSMHTVNALMRGDIKRARFGEGALPRRAHQR